MLLPLKHEGVKLNSQSHSQPWTLNQGKKGRVVTISVGCVRATMGGRKAELPSQQPPLPPLPLPLHPRGCFTPARPLSWIWLRSPCLLASEWTPEIPRQGRRLPHWSTQGHESKDPSPPAAGCTNSQESGNRKKKTGHRYTLPWDQYVWPWQLQSCFYPTFREVAFCTCSMA